jgi:hypothetical protein
VIKEDEIGRAKSMHGRKDEFTLIFPRETRRRLENLRCRKSYLKYILDDKNGVYISEEG